MFDKRYTIIRGGIKIKSINKSRRNVSDGADKDGACVYVLRDYRLREYEIYIYEAKRYNRRKRVAVQFYESVKRVDFIFGNVGFRRVFFPLSDVYIRYGIRVSPLGIIRKQKIF